MCRQEETPFVSLKQNQVRTNNQSGQALIEYILMLTVALGLVTSMTFTFRRVAQTLWQQMTCEVSAACPACPPAETVANRLVPGACR